MDTDIEPSDTLTGFINSLSTGAMIQVTLSGREAENANDLNTARARLVEIDKIARTHAPRGAPDLRLDSALWAARVMRFCCRMLVDRIETETALPEEIATQPSPSTPQHHWSTDLIFRTWWDLVGRAKKLSTDDPLNQTIASITKCWPLAAVGTNTTFESSQLDVIWSDHCLRRMLVDRVARRKDTELIKDQRIADAVQRIKEMSRT